MTVDRRLLVIATPVAVVLGALLVASCGGGSTGPQPGVLGTSSTTTTASFATLVGAPTTLTAAAASVAVPDPAGVSNVGGNVMIGAGAGGTAVVTVASVSSTVSTGGPPVSLSSFGRQVQDFSGTTITAQYYVGVTNTGTTPTTVTIPSLTLNVGIGAGQSTGLAHYDPTQPQNGWNQHCAFGTGQVTTNGNSTTYVPGGNGGTWTIYPGTTLWFAPYTYSSSSTASPTPVPTGQPTVVPSPAAVPSSLTGTYIGTATQTGQGSQYLEFSLTQSGSSISGTFAALPSSSNNNGAFGSLSGTVSNGSLSLTASSQYGGGCTTTAVLGTASGTLISGTFNSTGGSNCTGNNSGTFSVVEQSSSLPQLSGTYSGTIDDSHNGSGTLTLPVSTPGTVFSGIATVSFPSNPSAGGTNAVVGFITTATSGEFAVIGSGQQSCNPFGTLTVSNNGGTLVGSYANSSSGNGNSCTGTGSFTISN